MSTNRHVWRLACSSGDVACQTCGELSLSISDDDDYTPCVTDALRDRHITILQYYMYYVHTLPNLSHKEPVNFICPEFYAVFVCFPFLLGAGKNKLIRPKLMRSKGEGYRFYEVQDVVSQE